MLAAPYGRCAHDVHFYAQSSRVIYLAAGALGVVSALLLVLGVIFGWYSGWGRVLLVANIVVAVGMVGVHAAADRVGHRERCLSAVVALGLGVCWPRSHCGGCPGGRRSWRCW